jgi:beta-glucosidase
VSESEHFVSGILGVAISTSGALLMPDRDHALRHCRALIFGAAALVQATAALAQSTDRPWMNTQLPADQRAELVLKQLTLDEKLSLLHGNGMANNPMWTMPLTQFANGGAGYVTGIPRLGIPPLIISDAAYGVRDSGVNGRYSTAMPSNLGAAAAWDTESACEYGAVIGSELRAQGFDMTLGGGVDLAREPRNGRSFEYTGEDPLLAGTLDGNMMKCEQAQHVVGDLKHYALNDQETGRSGVDVVISKRAMQESDLLAFHIALSISNASAIMCSYNRINGPYACENPYTLNEVLKRDWGFRGFVLSDWAGTHSTQAASQAGLDQEQPMADFFGPKLRQAVDAGAVPLSEIDDHARRVLFAEFNAGIVDDPPHKSVVDVVRGLQVAQRVEEKSIVLLKNENGILPIDTTRVHSIAIIGGHADVGMISGGGSAQVDPPAGNAILPPGKGATHWQDHIWFPTPPVQALRDRLPGTKITFDSGTDLNSAAAAARDADLAIVVGYQWEAEDSDLASLALPDNQTALIENVAAANPHTIVVLESGTAVTMPWLDKVQGVLETWYAGSAGHRALAEVLTGEVNPSGKLPISFPKSEQDLPRSVIPPAPHRTQAAESAAPYAVAYTEGAAVGYRWYELEHKRPLFAFGFGLSYTTFAYSDLQIDAATRSVRFEVKNTGTRAGTEIAEVYARPPEGSDEPFQRLVGWARVQLAARETKTLAVAVDARVLQSFDEVHNRWDLKSGRYEIQAGPSSDNTPLHGLLRIH